MIQDRERVLWCIVGILKNNDTIINNNPEELLDYLTVKFPHNIWDGEYDVVENYCHDWSGLHKIQ